MTISAEWSSSIVGSLARGERGHDSHRGRASGRRGGQLSTALVMTLKRKEEVEERGARYTTPSRHWKPPLSVGGTRDRGQPHPPLSPPRSLRPRFLYRKGVRGDLHQLGDSLWSRPGDISVPIHRASGGV
ncbi:unnamed protein product [Lampetra fluviatilis]